MSLYSVTSLINIPFNLDASVFQYTGTQYDPYIVYMTATLYVPRGRTAVYGNVNGWENFMNISEIDTKYKLKYILDGEVYKTYEIQATEVITPEPDPYKEGYAFSGWSDIPYLMPAHDVTVTGSFSINSYKLTYMIDDKVYKETMYEYGATITPEPQPEGDYLTFEWVDLPKTMPAKDVTVYANYQVSGITNVMMSQGDTRVFSPNGKRLTKMQKGLNILRMGNGKTKKVVIR